MNPNYQLLRNITSPVVAITTTHGERTNGMIANSALRASLSPDAPLVSVYVHKFNLSHDMIMASGKFVMHLLHRRQFRLVHHFGFRSGRDVEKLDTVPHRLGDLGVPILDDCYAWIECTVANIMDTGSSTCFLGSVTDMGRGPGEELMDSEFMREAMPEEWKAQYIKDLERAQEWIRTDAPAIQSIYPPPE